LQLVDKEDVVLMVQLSTLGSREALLSYLHSKNLNVKASTVISCSLFDNDEEYLYSSLFENSFLGWTTSKLIYLAHPWTHFAYLNIYHTILSQVDSSNCLLYYSPNNPNSNKDTKIGRVLDLEMLTKMRKYYLVLPVKNYLIINYKGNSWKSNI